MKMEVEGNTVPVIDLANFPMEKEKLMSAATGLGCFRVINHGISEAIMADMKDSVVPLFELPTEVKFRNTDTIFKSGYVAPFQLSPLYEAFGIYKANSPTDIRSFCSLLGIPPQDEESFSIYASKLHGLVVNLASKVAEGLGIVGNSFEEWTCHIRINGYNFTNETLGSFGVQLHTDSNFISVILEDETNDGFEFMDSTGKFVAVDPVPGTFLVTIGDIGKVWSNGRLHNVKHRVLCKKSERRITIALFMLAPEDNMIEPHAKLIDSEHPRLYRNFDYMDYRKLRLATRSIAGEVLRNWALDEASLVAT